jgi:hypothetical protein
MDPETTAAWNKWAIEVVDGRVGAATQKWVKELTAAQLQSLAEGVGQVVAEVRNEERARMRREIEDRCAKSDAATVELILGLERKIEELEQRAVMRPVKPKLVGGPDAAD